MSPSDQLTRIGVFYDGGFFSHVSNYYLFQHPRKARISIGGLHDFVRDRVAQEEGAERRYCRIVDAHYFRGRLSAHQAKERGEDFLAGERRWDEILMREGVVTHYLPLGSEATEKGIDVWLALEAFELAMFKRFSVTVLVAGDGDYVPLVRKLNTLGTRVMLLAWDFEYADPAGRRYATRTSQTLIGEVTYPVMMSEEIEGRAQRKDATLDGLFVPRKDEPFAADAAPGGGRTIAGPDAPPQPPGGAATAHGTVLSLFDGYGFIRRDEGGASLFFHRSALQGVPFSSLHEGMRVDFVEGVTERGPYAISVQAADPPAPGERVKP